MTEEENITILTRKIRNLTFNIRAKYFGMLCAAINNSSLGLSNSQTSRNKMLSTEDYYKQSEQRMKMENIFNYNNNNNTFLPHDTHLQESTSALLNDLNEFKTLTSQNNTGSLDEHRALQLALELSMLGLTNEDEINFADMRTKKSMNTTECVPVPSSEHVAEIVGRQGCKIKALRSKTNTYIKTPVRGEEPVFVVTGRKEDVHLAKREIMQAADHFSQIRASRRNSTSLSPIGPPSPTTPGHVTKQVRVPYRVVGLVVGPKGSTIKRIQQATNTYIVTPSRDKEPVFEVTGLPDNVDRAKREVEHHIALRTGGIFDPTHPETNEHLLNGYSSSLFSPTGSTNSGGFSSLLDHNLPGHPHQRAQSMDSYNYLSGQSSNSSKFSDLGGVSTVNSPFTNNSFLYDAVIPSPTADIDNLGQFDPAPGSPSPSIWPDMLRKGTLMNRTVGSQGYSHRSMSTSTYTNGERSSPAHLRRLMSEGGNESYSVPSISYSQYNGSSSNIPSSAHDILSNGDLKISSDGESGSSTPDWLVNKGKQCYVCKGKNVVAALVPCGHNLFCMECAEQVKEADGECPACHKKIEAVLRIFS
ncbi:RNA-binding protein MEX3B [Hydra vulgaris]|uniref:RNA-binding protein MEX3B n=1 Tax=Hydra vulgaris TaxID=6087 RepID=A0ABM4DDE1_HYDVU|nr:RNA-binding protein MEX3B [Hydra vulgaris]